MSKLNVTSKFLLASALSAGMSGFAQADGIQTKAASSFPGTVKNPAPGEIIVKCAGIAKRGKNHCGANDHACRGHGKTDFDKNEWIYVRKEVCEATPGRIIGRKRVVEG